METNIPITKSQQEANWLAVFVVHLLNVFLQQIDIKCFGVSQSSLLAVVVSGSLSVKKLHEIVSLGMMGIGRYRAWKESIGIFWDYVSHFLTGLVLNLFAIRIIFFIFVTVKLIINS